MADITITIKDLPDDKVSVVSKPNFAEMMRDGKGKLTGAEGYALYALNMIREVSQNPDDINLSVKGLLKKKPAGIGNLLPWNKNGGKG